jgi:hypothetical protein
MPALVVRLSLCQRRRHFLQVSPFFAIARSEDHAAVELERFFLGIPHHLLGAAAPFTDIPVGKSEEDRVVARAVEKQVKTFLGG